MTRVVKFLIASAVDGLILIRSLLIDSLNGGCSNLPCKII